MVTKDAEEKNKREELISSLQFRFLDTGGDLKELDGRLSDALDEEFGYGIAIEVESKGIQEGLRDRIINFGLFKEEEIQRLKMSGDGTITDPESLQEFGHASGYYALLRIRGERMGGNPLKSLKWTREERDENQKNVTESISKKRKIATVHESITLNDGKRILFVKMGQNCTQEPKLLKENIPEMSKNLPAFIPFDGNEGDLLWGNDDEDDLLWGDDGEKHKFTPTKIDTTQTKLNVPHVEIHSREIDDFNPSKRNTDLFKYSIEGTLILGSRFIYLE
eukprot:TRINITY_DN6170_c0_g1_i2.p1 TRINITY_DN6170_c0_g1~~TRINITY_DN6170_c0_g1_i2.p1  ORF type:complete len:278 (-),score=71.28 TRINITY_DN6170_c0_g1_i2:175-1008(-)